MPPKDAEGHSYGFNYGSNGERDLMRAIAGRALGLPDPAWLPTVAGEFVAALKGQQS